MIDTVCALSVGASVAVVGARCSLVVACFGSLSIAFTTPSTPSEKFGKSFDDELDDWVYVHAVRLGDGRIVHTACAGALQDNSVKSEHR